MCLLLQPILETLGKACSLYGRRNLRMLYDALSTLADMVGRPLAQPDCIQLFMPPLLQRWQSTEDTDRELLPLLEVFTTIAQALGMYLASLCGITEFVAAPPCPWPDHVRPPPPLSDAAALANHGGH